VTRRAIALAGFTVVNLAATVALQLFIVARVGLGGTADAYFASSTLPQLVLATLVGASVSVIVPMFSGREKTLEVTMDAWAILSIGVIALLFSAVAIFLSARFATDCLLPGLSPSSRIEAVALTRIAAVGLPFTGLALILGAIHQGFDRFVPAAALSAVTSVGLLAAAVLAVAGGGLIAIAWLGVVRSVIQVFCLLPGLGKPSVDLKRPAVGELWAGMKPLLFSASYFKLAPLLDRWFASYGAGGDISLLHLMQQVFAGAATLFGKSVVDPFLASVAKSRMLNDDPDKNVGIYVKIKRRTALLISIAYVAGFFVIACAIKFIPNIEDVNRIVQFYVAFGGLYTAGFLGQIAAAWFYAHGETSVPAKVGAFGFTIGIAVRAMLFQPLGALSVAVGVSVTQIVNWLMLNRLATRGRLRQ